MFKTAKMIAIIIVLLSGLYFNNQIYSLFTPLVSSVSSSTIPTQEVIQKVMDYQMPHIIKRYCKDYDISFEDAKIHETELKRFFVLAGTSDEPIDMFSKEVDNLWHTFLLFTRDYQRFCHDMFGKFIHHDPLIET